MASDEFRVGQVLRANVADRTIYNGDLPVVAKVETRRVTAHETTREQRLDFDPGSAQTWGEFSEAMFGAHGIQENAALYSAGDRSHQCVGNA